VTAVKWIRNTHILVSFGDGSIYLKSVTETHKEPTLLFKEMFNPIRDMVLISFNIVFAMESGEVKTIALNMDQPVLTEAVKLCYGLRQSALCLDFFVKDEQTLLLACGFENQVQVYSLFGGEGTSNQNQDHL
jgi:hypothetical protein